MRRIACAAQPTFKAPALKGRKSHFVEIHGA
jgi:hypothetical protein